MAKITLKRDTVARFRLRRRAREHFRDFIDWAQEHPPNRWVFRGQSQAWTLKPVIGRGLAPYRPEFEILLLKEFRRAAVPFLPALTSASDWDWLAVAQHYGLPTRLIDWTTNALVACYFACQPSPRGKRSGQIVAVDAQDIGFFNADDPTEVGPFEIESDRFVKAPALAGRLVSQKGLFSVHRSPTTSWRLRDRRDFFEIPAELKPEFQHALFSMGVDSAFLMADLDGLSETLKWRWMNGVLS